MHEINVNVEALFFPPASRQMSLCQAFSPTVLQRMSFVASTGKIAPWNNVRSHMKSSTVGCASLGYVSMGSSRRSHSGLSQRAAPGTLNLKNRQSLEPMRRSHLQLYPTRNDRRRACELERWARPGDRLAAPRARTRGH